MEVRLGKLGGKQTDSWRRGWLGGSLLIGLYLASYGVARADHFVVHAQSFAGMTHSTGAVVVSHQVRSGDPGIPVLNPVWTLMVLGSGRFFAPLMLLETGFWYVVRPRGTPWNGPLEGSL